MSEIWLATLLVSFVAASSGEPFVDPNIIPEYLLECYRTPVQLLPLSLRTLIDLIRKIELQPYYEADLRMQIDAILSRFWRDGIKRDPNVAKVLNVLPYSGDGTQFYKYNILRRLIPLGSSNLPTDALTLNERCTLHRMLSSGMEIWERGDEFRVCPYAEYQHQETSVQLTGAKKSGCPIELGVVQSDFGTLSPNHVLLGIAASLQRSVVEQKYMIPANTRFRKGYSLEKTIDNFWAATVAGDMAEMLIFQLPYSQTPVFGPGGFWNDSLLPALFYQKTDYNGVLFDFWEDTNAELLGGLDGVIIGNQLSNWDLWQRNLRLSQVLEMFYQKGKEQYPNQLGVCSRKEYFEGVLIQNRVALEQQVVNFAEVLSVRSENFVMNTTVVTENKSKIFNAYTEHMRNHVLRTYPKCGGSHSYIEPKVRLNVIFDATWDQYTTLRILMKVAEEIDISYYGSTMSVINGVTGHQIISYARSAGDAYIRWMLSNDSAKETRSSDITNGFLTLKKLIESEEFRINKHEPAGDVTLVLGRTSFLTDGASQRVTSTLKAIKLQIPDMRFVYVIRTPDSRPWVKLTSLPYSQNDKIVTIDDDNFEHLYDSLEEALETVPSSISPPPCTKIDSDKITLEQYVTPGVSKFYSIHPSYFCGSSYIDIEIENFDNGQITLCMSRYSIKSSDDLQCTNYDKFEKKRLRVDEPCYSKTPNGPNEAWDNDCRPIQIRITAFKSTRSCSGKGCRFIDQVKYKMNIWGMKCTTEDGPTCSGSHSLKQAFALYISFFLIIWVQNVI